MKPNARQPDIVYEVTSRVAVSSVRQSHSKLLFQPLTPFSTPPTILLLSPSNGPSSSQEDLLQCVSRSDNSPIFLATYLLHPLTVGAGYVGQ